MRRAVVVGGLLCLLGAAGCGDPPHRVLRDTLTTLNEAADALMLIKDEESALTVIKTKIEPLRKKWQLVRKRQDEFRNMDKDDKAELAELLLNYVAESKATGQRLAGQGARLSALRDQLMRGRGGNPDTALPGLSAAAKVPAEFIGGGGPGVDAAMAMKDPLAPLNPQKK